MRKISVIGIGAGSPDHLTLQAVAAMRATDVFFVIDKGDALGDLRSLRDAMLRDHARGGHRVVEIAEVERDRDPIDYEAAVADWHAARAASIGDAIRDELEPDGVGSFLVWGDPSLYDSTLRVLDQVAARGDVAFEVEVVPGISSVLVLAAAHRTSLHGVGEPVLITTGRRLADDLDLGVPNTVVLLDGQQAVHEVDPGGVEVLWGAYLGTDDELLARGPLATAGPEIAARRAAAKAEKGWIMDSYLLRRRAAREGEDT